MIATLNRALTAGSIYATITEVNHLYWDKVDKSGRCWGWTGALSPNGYGKFTIDGRTVYAHIVAYVLAYGPVPEGKQIDHVKDRGCTSKACVNPEHLEAVPQRTNILRGDSPTAINARKTHCVHGHEFTPENTRWTSETKRVCRACHREDSKQRRQKAMQARSMRRLRERRAQQQSDTQSPLDAA